LDRLILRGKLCALYSPEGMNVYLDANKILRKDFEQHTTEVTKKIVQASIGEAKDYSGPRKLDHRLS